ncbi:DUF6916 family protein [Novipirellula sp. SH528]|uniref:DUF6916 family protein n=1 Tax=Novipirellula sp. SH528 TaxID=3454466 RepID=UPI003FA039C3
MSTEKTVADSKKVILAEFSPHVGSTFNLRVTSDESVDVQLVEAGAIGSVPGQFALLFHDANASVASHLPQSIYSFAHEKLGEYEIFVVPVGPGPAGEGVLYEAVFA